MSARDRTRVVAGSVSFFFDEEEKFQKENFRAFVGACDHVESRDRIISGRYLVYFGTSVCLLFDPLLLPRLLFCSSLMFHLQFN